MNRTQRFVRWKVGTVCCESQPLPLAQAESLRLKLQTNGVIASVSTLPCRGGWVRQRIVHVPDIDDDKYVRPRAPLITRLNEQLLAISFAADMTPWSVVTRETKPTPVIFNYDFDWKRGRWIYHCSDCVHGIYLESHFLVYWLAPGFEAVNADLVRWQRLAVLPKRWHDPFKYAVEGETCDD